MSNSRQPLLACSAASWNSRRRPRTRRSCALSYHRIQIRPAGGSSRRHGTAKRFLKSSNRSSTVDKLGYPQSLGERASNIDLDHIADAPHAGKAEPLSLTQEQKAILDRAVEHIEPAAFQ